MAKLCFLFGHRDAPEDILPELIRTAEKHYVQYGIREYVVGQYGNFDHLAVRAIREVKKKHEDVRLLLLTPYYSPERPQQIPEGCDGTLYPDGMERVPKRVSIVRANRYMIGRADSVICYVNRPGNARELLGHALILAKSADNIV